MALAGKVQRYDLKSEAFYSWKAAQRESHVALCACKALAQRWRTDRAGILFLAWRKVSHRRCWRRQAVRLYPCLIAYFFCVCPDPGSGDLPPAILIYHKLWCKRCSQHDKCMCLPSAKLAKPLHFSLQLCLPKQAQMPLMDTYNHGSDGSGEVGCFNHLKSREILLLQVKGFLMKGRKQRIMHAFSKLKGHREEAQAQRKALEHWAHSILTACFRAFRFTPSLTYSAEDIKLKQVQV